jgi:hypothetical protein
METRFKALDNLREVFIVRLLRVILQEDKVGNLYATWLAFIPWLEAVLTACHSHHPVSPHSLLTSSDSFPEALLTAFSQWCLMNVPLHSLER